MYKGAVRVQGKLRQSFAAMSQPLSSSSSSNSSSALLGLDKEGRPRAIFLYDGGCGV